MRKKKKYGRRIFQVLLCISWWECKKPRFTSLTTHIEDDEILQKKAKSPLGREKIFDCQKGKNDLYGDFQRTSWNGKTFSGIYELSFFLTF